MAKIIMNVSHLSGIKLLNTPEFQVSGKLQYKNKSDKFNWIKNLLDRLLYKKLEKHEKHEVVVFLCSITDHKADYIRHLTWKYEHGSLKIKKYVRSKPYVKYQVDDVSLLANTDILHKRMSAPATKHILSREYNLYHDEQYKNISLVSASHINNLRKRTTYQCKYKNGTKARLVGIGITKKPQPNGKPGSIRIDTVHQRDIYYINAVDEITQWELVFCVPRISEFFLLPILELMLSLFPFEIFNFHSDRGGEYINEVVAGLLNKLKINQTKSRSRHCNDQALIECKNGVVIRKHMGYGYITENLAPEINRYCVDYFNDYLNFHRPCAFARHNILPDGKVQLLYEEEDYMTPFEKLQSLPNWESYLRSDFTAASLRETESEYSDNEFAKLLQIERRKLIKLINQGSSFDIMPPESSTG